MLLALALPGFPGDLPGDKPSGCPLQQVLERKGRWAAGGRSEPCWETWLGQARRSPLQALRLGGMLFVCRRRLLWS